jgi:ribosome-associated toxin RatA of RatAB toxin-antitoxin module
MFDLVNDIERYPEFIPNCSGAVRKDLGNNETEGSLQISKAGLSKWFTTRNQLAAPNCIKLQFVDGPFRQLQGEWRFTELDSQACKVELELEFEFSSKLIEMAFGQLFNQVITSMVKAFTDRAREFYGR